MKDPEIRPENYFWLKDNRQIKSLEELSKILEDIPLDVFNHHVNDTKNDFANWIRDVFKKKGLSEEIGKKNTAKEIIECLKKERKIKAKDNIKIKKEAKNIVKRVIKPIAIKKKAEKRNKNKVIKTKIETNKNKNKKRIKTKKQTKRLKKSIEKDAKDIIEKKNIPKKEIRGLKPEQKKVLSSHLNHFNGSLIDFLLGILIGILIAVMLSKVI
jgi:hypothetical protein